MIYVMHGVVRDLSPRLLTHRGFLDAEKFDRYLKDREPFVAVADAAKGKGDALTIDDATVAAYDAALLARKHGHEVALFVNSASSVQYLNSLSSLLEGATPDELARLSNAYLPPVTTERPHTLSSLREVLKDTLTRLPDEDARTARLRQIVSQIGGREIELPAHFRSLSQEQLQHLVDRGVRLENHGATHVDYAIFNGSDMRAQVTSCKSWLASVYRQDAHYFAVPFGNVLPRFELSEETASLWLLQSRVLSPGPLGSKIYNRSDLLI